MLMDDAKSRKLKFETITPEDGSETWIPGISDYENSYVDPRDSEDIDKRFYQDFTRIASFKSNFSEELEEIIFTLNMQINNLHLRIMKLEKEKRLK